VINTIFSAPCATDLKKRRRETDRKGGGGGGVWGLGAVGLLEAAEGGSCCRRLVEA